MVTGQLQLRGRSMLTSTIDLGSTKGTIDQSRRTFRVGLTDLILGLNAATGECRLAILRIYVHRRTGIGHHFSTDCRLTIQRPRICFVSVKLRHHHQIPLSHFGLKIIHRTQDLRRTITNRTYVYHDDLAVRCVLHIVIESRRKGPAEKM